MRGHITVLGKSFLLHDKLGTSLLRSRLRFDKSLIFIHLEEVEFFGGWIEYLGFSDQRRFLLDMHKVDADRRNRCVPPREYG